MVECAVTGEAVRAVGQEATVRVGTSGWRPAPAAGSLPCPVDTILAGRTRGLAVPSAAIALRDPSSGETRSPPAQLSDEEHLLIGGGPVETVLGFAGPATVERGDGGTRVAFRESTRVTIGFREGGEPPSRLTVPATPEGVATALTHAAAGLETTAPARSHPAYRSYPPLVDLGERDVPASTRAATPETGIAFRLPESLPELFVAAPLAYYLGATVTTGERETPLLTAPAAGVEHRFSRLPAFQREATTLLRRIFTLDCLVRDPDRAARPRAPGPGDGLPFDPPAVRSLAPDERLARYLELPSDLPTERPDWPLSTYVSPVYENVGGLPHLLDRLGLVYLPETSDLDPKERLERSLADFYRAGEVASVDVCRPELRAGDLHGWLAEGTPIDVFKTTVNALDNGLAARRRHPEPISVDVVLNDAEMADELTAADIYRERAADLPVEVSVHESLAREELVAVFETPTDFVHYVGHCEVDGLECSDGWLAAADLDASRARTFFLNACGSYREGMALVEQGSVAGAVTLTQVLNDQAVTVGTAFARLLIHGYGIERALSLARRRILMGKDYAVVGDGTYSLVPSSGCPGVVRVTSRGSDYEVRYGVSSSLATGRTFRDPFAGERRLYGTGTTSRVNREELVSVLSRSRLPVIFDGAFRWSTSLAADLEG